MTENIERINKEVQEHSQSSHIHEGRGKYLVFDIGGEKYGIPLNMVKEVIGLTDITSVPSVPKFFRGLINLRGKVISVIDFRLKVGLPEEAYQDKKTTIIIAEVGALTIGTIVDAVSEVVSFEMSDIEEDLDIQSYIEQKFITGVAKGEDNKLVLLLDIGKVLSVDELELLKSKTESEAA